MEPWYSYSEWSVDAVTYKSAGGTTMKHVVMACIFKMKLKYLLTFAFMITFTGCSTPQESPPVVYSDATLPFVLPEGIFYQDKIYWKSDVDTQEEINGQELGVIKESVSR